MSRFPRALLAAVSLLALSGAASAADIAAGEKVYAKCRACHMVGDDARHKVGPELNDIFGQAAGGAEGYNYSKAMKEAGAGGLVWNDETIAAYIENPKAYIKGNKMAFAGLKKEEDRVNVIAYLKQ